MTDIPQVDLLLTFLNTKHGINDMYMDLYKAISCYRLYDSFDELLDLNPELLNVKLDLKELWDELDKMTESELAEVSLDLLGVTE